MTTTTTVTRGIPIPAQRGISQRLPGILAGIGGALYVIAGLRMTFDNDAYDTTPTAVLSLLWCLGGLAGLIGIARLGVTPGRLGRVALVAAVAGFGCALFAWVIGFDDPRAVDESVAMNIGRVLRLLGFLGLGLATARARRWTGWRRLTPFLYPLAVVLGGLSAVALDVELTVTLIGLAWVGIGSIIATSSPDGARRAASR